MILVMVYYEQDVRSSNVIQLNSDNSDHAPTFRFHLLETAEADREATIFMKTCFSKSIFCDSGESNDSFVINLLLDAPTIFIPDAVVRRCSVKKVLLRIS